MRKFTIKTLLSESWCLIVFCTSLFICHHLYLYQTTKADSYATTRYNDVTYSPDNKRIAATSTYYIWLYDAQTFQNRIVFKAGSGYDYTPNNVMFSPDGKMLAVDIEKQKEIQLFNPKNGELISTLKGLQDKASCIAFSPDSKTLASGNYDKTIMLWDIDTGKLLKTLKGHTERVSSIAFSPDGKTLASASYDKTIRLWDLPTGAHHTTLKGHKEIIYAVAYSPDGKLLLSSGLEKILFWDTHTGQHLKTIIELIDSVESITFSADGGMFAARTHQEIKFWNIENDEFRTSSTNIAIPPFPTNLVKGNVKIEFSPDGNTLASFDELDSSIHFFDVKTGLYKGIISQPQRNIKRSTSFSQDGKRIARTTRDMLNVDVIRFWQIPIDKLQMPIHTTLTLEMVNTRFSKMHKELVKSIHFSPDGKTVASVSNRVIVLWDTVKGTPKTILKDPPTQFYSLAFSPDSKTLATGDGWNNNQVRLWDTHTGKLKATLKGHNTWIDSLAYSPDRKFLVSGSRDGKMRVWNPKTGEHKVTLEGHTKIIHRIVFSPNGKLFASTSHDNIIILWDILSTIQKGQPKVIFKSNTARRTYHLKFSPDSRTLALVSGGDDKTIRLRDTKTGQNKTTLQGHTSYIDFLDFSPDGQTLISGSRDNTVRLWDMKTGTIRAILDKNRERWSHILISPHGRTLVTQEDSQTFHLWNLKTGKLRATIKDKFENFDAFAFIHGGSTLLSMDWSNTLHVWDAETGEFQMKIKTQREIR